MSRVLQTFKTSRPAERGENNTAPSERSHSHRARGVRGGASLA
jgi:hypothetical protein